MSCTVSERSGWKRLFPAPLTLPWEAGTISTKQKRFTPQSIERLNYHPHKAPPSGKMEIRDDVVRGLLLRVPRQRFT